MTIVFLLPIWGNVIDLRNLPSKSLFRKEGAAMLKSITLFAESHNETNIEWD